MKVTTRRATATERFHAEARKKRIPPLVFLFGGIGAAFAAVIGVILFGGGEREEEVRSRFEERVREGAARQMDDRLDEAAARYREAMGIVEGNERFRSAVIDLKGRLREIEGRKADLKAARAALEAFRARAERRKPGDLVDLSRDGNNLLERLGPLKDGLKPLVAAIDAELAEKLERDRRCDFESARARINSKHRLGLTGVGCDWSAAIREWRDYLGLPIREEDRPRALGQVAWINQLAREEFLRLRRSAESMDKGEAIRSLEKERPRFERTASFDDLENLRQDLRR